MELSFGAAVAIATFAAVILAIASNRLHLTVAAFLGVVALLLTGVLSAEEVSETINPGEATIALFFGGMVMARVLTPTGLFEYLAGIALGLVRNDGRRVMIAVVIIAAPKCAILPNAAVVILVAPLIISMCRQTELDFVQPVILLVFVANSGGLFDAGRRSGNLYRRQRDPPFFRRLPGAAQPRRGVGDPGRRRSVAPDLPLGLARPHGGRHGVRARADRSAVGDAGLPRCVGRDDYSVRVR